MAQLIAKISKGSKMDQIYIPKNRPSNLETGAYVIIEPALKKPKVKLYYYNVADISPIKVKIIKDIFRNSDAENILIAGSFLEKGFHFDDIDIIIINGRSEGIKKLTKQHFGIKAHIITLSHKDLQIGLNTDPLYQMLLSKFVARKRMVLKIKPQVNFQLLDLHLLKSNILIDNYDIHTGKEKYKLVRNMIAIKLFLERKKVTNRTVNQEINLDFGRGSVENIINNTVGKDFLNKYKRMYNKLFNRIMEGVRGSQ